MDKADFLEMMEDILGVPEGSLSGEEAFADLKGWDSLAVLGVVAMARENPGVSLRPEQVKGLATLADLYALLVEMAG